MTVNRYKTGAGQPPPSLTEMGVYDLTRREMLVRAGAAGAALSLSGALLAACGGNDSPATSAAGEATDAEIDHVTWGVVGEAPENLNIAQSFTITGVTAGFLGAEGLLTTDSSLKLQPALAEAWSQPDPLHYVFELRQGVEFWDGTRLTIDDVVYSITWNMDPANASQIGFFFGNVASVKAQGQATVVVTMAKPDPTLPQILTFTPIFPKSALAQADSGFGSPGAKVNFVGTGPYEITSFTTESGVEVRRNEAYWGELPRVKSGSLKYFDSPQTMLLAARDGSIDGAFGFPLSDAEAWSDVSGVATEFLKEEGLTIGLLSFDLESEPWSDIHVRRAVAHCCDTSGYVEAFLDGQASPATTIVPPAQWANVASPSEVTELYDSVQQYAYSIEDAKAELAQSTHPDGFSATIQYPSTYPHLGKALVSLSETLKEIGITLKVSKATETQWLTQLAAHKDLGIQALLYSPDYADPSDYLLVFDLSANAVPNAFNLANVKSPQIDRLLEQQAEATDNSERTRLLGEVLKFNAEQLPYMPLWWEGPAVAIADEDVYNGLNGLYYYQPWLGNIGVRA